MENFILDSEALELNHPFLLVREKQKILEKIHSKYQDENVLFIISCFISLFKT